MSTIRRDVLKRDKGTCQRCSLKTPYGRGLIIHQMDKEKSVDDIINLILLCEDCQKLVMRRWYKTREDIVGRDPLLDGYKVGNVRYRVVVLGVDNGWQAVVYGSQRHYTK